MEDNKKSQENKSGKPTSNTNSQPMPEEYSNTANHKGATDLGTDGTKPSASQQQGQGAWSKKTDRKDGSDSGKGDSSNSDS